MTYRAFSDSTWSDPWFEDLNANQKYLFIYLFTNESIKRSGIYEISIKKMAFQTMLPVQVIEEILPTLHPKIIWVSSRSLIYVTRYFCNQCQNPSFANSAIKELTEEFPEFIKMFLENNENILKKMGVDTVKLDTVSTPYPYSVDTPCDVMLCNSFKKALALKQSFEKKAFCSEVSDEDLQADPEPIPVEEKKLEDPTPAKEPDPVIITFPCNGRTHSWDLTQSRLEGYTQLYQGLDVLYELKKARQWIFDKSNRKKTARGMPAFCTNWLSRANDAFNHSSAIRERDPPPNPEAQRKAHQVNEEIGRRIRQLKKPGQVKDDIEAYIRFQEQNAERLHVAGAKKIASEKLWEEYSNLLKSFGIALNGTPP
jgi:hypothetical protein